MLNTVTIMGRLTKDPELRRTQNGVAVTSFTIACDRDFDTNGERETDFVDCVAWRATAEFVDNYFSKGNMIAVIGRLQFRNWEDKDGNKRRNAEVQCEHCYFAQKKEKESNAAYSAPDDNSYAIIEANEGQFPF